MRIGDSDAIDLADELCVHGQPRSPLEMLFDCRDEISNLFAMSGGSEAMKTQAKQGECHPRVLNADDLYCALQRVEKQISDNFLDAVRRRDGNKILEIAEIVMGLKNREPFANADPKRRWILFLKYRIGKSSETMSVAEVVNFLNAYTATKIERTDDGYSQIRRMCKELDFPLSPTRKTSRK